MKKTLNAVLITVALFASSCSDAPKYTFNGCEKIDGKDYIKLIVDDRQKDETENMLVLVKNWQKLEGIKRTNGISYYGAELSGLELEATNDPHAKYVYKNLRSIVD